MCGGGRTFEHNRRKRKTLVFEIGGGRAVVWTSSGDGADDRKPLSGRVYEGAIENSRSLGENAKNLGCQIGRRQAG